MKTTFPNIQNKHENVLIHDDPSHSDYPDNQDDPDDHGDTEIHDESFRECKNVLERPISAQFCLILSYCA